MLFVGEMCYKLLKGQGNAGRGDSLIVEVFHALTENEHYHEEFEWHTVRSELHAYAVQLCSLDKLLQLYGNIT